MCTLSGGTDIEPLSCQNFIGVGLCEGKGGCFDVVVVFIILFFSKSELKTPNHFLAKQTEFGKNIFIDNISITNIFQVAH